jgi:hypothetical protein
MKIKPWHLLAAGAAAYLYSQVTKIKNLQFNSGKIHVENWKFLNVDGYMNSSITNPTDSTIVVQYFKGALYYGKFYLTDVSVMLTILKPGEKKPLKISFNIPYFKFLGEIQAIINSGWLLYQFRVQGDLIYKVGTLPEITVKVNQAIPLAETYTP